MKYIPSLKSPAIVAALLGLALAASAQVVSDLGKSLGITSVPNLRDVGGYTTRDGSVVRLGVAYRSAKLTPISCHRQ